MARRIRKGILLGVVAGIGLAAGSAQPEGTSAQDGAQALTVPDGFTIERVAGPPLVERPIVADFDEEGRLYVADSSGSNDRTERQLEARPHRIVRLEDADGDGVFDRSTVFADRMMLPQGAMWLDGSLYVAAPPSIWKLTDTNGDGVADRREEWFQGGTLTGCANDLHGPYLGPDGWIYWTKGAFAEQAYAREDGPPLVTRAAHVFRRRPGDPAVDVVMTGGMDNPVDVAFTSSGERILTATFVEHPQRGKRDGLIHAVYGGVYGKPHAVLDGHPRTGDLMPVLADLGPAVPSGLTRYASAVFGDAYRDNFFATMFNLRKVTRFVLQPEGASFAAAASDFVVSSSRDFHPTDVIEDADGSLLVIDTGPWYKMCCPTSQLARPDVPGAIYRVRRTGAAAPRDPRGVGLAWGAFDAARLADLLGDERIAVQQRATRRIAALGPAAVAALHTVLTGSTSRVARQNAVHALARMDGPDARAAVRHALQDGDEGIRQAAIHTAGLWRDRAAVPQLVDLLQTGSPPVRRSAAEALGRTGDPRAVLPLLTAAGTPADRTLEHSLTYALIEIADAPSTASGLDLAPPRARRAALIALDQMPRGGLPADVIVPLLDSSDPVLRDTAWWIADRHPDWARQLAGFFETRLIGAAASDDALEERLARFADNADVQVVLAKAIGASHPQPGRMTALGAMARARLKVLPSTWSGPLAAAMGERDSQIVVRAVAVARALPAAPDAAAVLDAALVAVARDDRRSLALRLDSLAARRAARGPDEELFELLLRALDATQPASIRTTAAGILGTTALDAQQLRRLAAQLEQIGPLELPRVLPAFAASGDEAVGLMLLAALERSPGRSAIRPEVLRPHLAKFPAAVRQQGDALLAALHVDTAAQGQRLDSTLARLTGGDVRRGQAVFNSEKAACASCHAIGYLGGTLGPDLTRIGEVRTERDLLEAILFPSVSFPRGYEPMLVTTTGGEVLSGVLRSERHDEVVLATATRDELRIPRTTIAEMQPGTVSLMPPGLADQLTSEELRDLLAFLKATRWGAN